MSPNLKLSSELTLMYHSHLFNLFRPSKKNSKNFYKLKKRRRPTKLPKRNCRRKPRNKLTRSPNSGPNMNKANWSGKNLGNQDKSLTNAFLNAVKQPLNFFKSVLRSVL
jgi:hypothetical protein